MTDVSKLTADNILAIAVDKPELLFTGDTTIAKMQYRTLVSAWHPDQNPMVDDRVIAHINILYELATFRLKTDNWVLPGVLVLKSIDGKRFNLKYKSTRSFELGDIYVGDTIIAYSLFKDNADLFKNAIKMIKNLKYANDEMKTEIKRSMPEIQTELETDDRLVLLIKKTPDQLLLSDVIDHLKGSIDPKHAAWIVSRLYNLACYLKYSNIVHCGFVLDSCLMSPQEHTISLVGGWWYSVENGRKLLALPGVAIDHVPTDVLDDEMGDFSLDLEMIKAIGRQILGDINGSKLIMDKNIPGPLVNWLRNVATEDAFKEYEIWQSKVLIDSFGKRKFVELHLAADDLYGAKK